MGRQTLAVLATLWLLSSASVTLQEPAPAPYRLVPGWGALPGGATWGEVPGLAIDAKGKIFAFHRSEPLTGQPGGHLVWKLAKGK